MTKILKKFWIYIVLPIITILVHAISLKYRIMMVAGILFVGYLDHKSMTKMEIKVQELTDEFFRKLRVALGSVIYEPIPDIKLMKEVWEETNIKERWLRKFYSKNQANAFIELEKAYDSYIRKHFADSQGAFKEDLVFQKTEELIEDTNSLIELAYENEDIFTQYLDRWDRIIF